MIRACHGIFLFEVMHNKIFIRCYQFYLNIGTIQQFYSLNHGYSNGLTMCTEHVHQRI